MAIFKKLVTALRGGINEAGEAIIDTQALRILDQEIRDADSELKQAKESLANIIAQQKLAAKVIKETQSKIDEYESYAIKALESGNEELAVEIAEKLGILENELENNKQQENYYDETVKSLRQSISQTEINIRNLKQQVDIVKATESVQKAQSAVAQRYGGSTAKLQTALDSLDRIKKRQDKNSALIEAKNELAKFDNQNVLDSKLEAAGIKSGNKNAAAILARLKEKHDNQSI
ncbi:PspA/IM30 family protein [Gilliamella sp. B2776]|uniref:PspA/IM30 family protein n=1 Tax=unclassified Gilliamella TaxID=2685620 RepID=UPI00226A8808|nr:MULTISPECIES: PspA/IM30 family protein [unclassified Gilliamella]MCX8649709.1 PspA/IM30 family protein [Gilliamella sp. B2779]MCX8654068.1 PspA/IM30 family protein [Gilliamella sp. B2737]MCX8665095.1 PspA/IM30 family protein [Gilliamella sp. B2887]MCX8691301.1 PspA/IM30 family protein [Gilliamella sp. B2776]MCX8697685.1 PspA/IM30 family protein [Gilliamella sp. B3000]